MRGGCAWIVHPLPRPVRLRDPFLHKHFPFDPMTDFLAAATAAAPSPFRSGTRTATTAPLPLSVHLDNTPATAPRTARRVEPIAISSREDANDDPPPLQEVRRHSHNRVAGGRQRRGLMQLAARPLANPPFPSVTM
jgi:hypothetical protein